MAWMKVLVAGVILLVVQGCGITRFSFYEENDVFGGGGGSDNNYTQGGRMSFRVVPESVPEFVKKTGDVLTRSGTDQRSGREYEVFLGHQIYTPNDLRRPDVIVDDRPYAGWLYTGVAMYRPHLDADPDERADSQTMVEVDLGVVGPWSLAEDAQTWFHERIDSTDPQGWDNQLDNEPGLVLTYKRQARNFHADLDLFGLQVDTISHFSLSVGNVATNASMGNTLRLGWDLPRDFGISVLQPSVATSPVDQDRGWSLYAFGGAEGRFVVRDIFLDGNTLQDSHSVSKHPLVADLRVGVGALIGKFVVGFTYVYRTEEFKAQESPHQFGSLVVSFPF